MHQGLLLGIDLYDERDKLIATTMHREMAIIHLHSVKITEFELEKGERLLGITSTLIERRKMIAANYNLRFLIGNQN